MKLVTAFQRENIIGLATRASDAAGPAATLQVIPTGVLIAEMLNQTHQVHIRRLRHRP